MKSLSCSSIAACLALLTATTQAYAEVSQLDPAVGYNHGEQESPRSLAMGGALRALSNSTEAALINPANLAATRVYHLAGLVQIWPQAARQSYGAAAVDSIVNQHGIAGGVTATWTQQDSGGLDRSSFDLRFGLAAPLGDQFSLGAALHYVSLTQDGYPRTGDVTSPSRASAGLAGEDILGQAAADAGVTLRLIPELSMSFVGHNLAGARNALMPLAFGGGLGLGTDVFSAEVDAVLDLDSFEQSRWQTQAGGELLLAESVALRGGYRFDQGLKTHGVSGGLGYLETAYSVEAGVRGNVSGPKSLTVVLSFKLQLDGAGMVL